ncbi:MAG: HDOD domain-containing protein [Thioalkalivibrio sp.]|nr:HDOD domain-containing protein [Thioalkalivibrio sp.]
MDILILEHDEVNAGVLRNIVQGLYPGSHVRTAATLAEGREQWQRHMPDLVLCEWDLPDGTGLDFASRVHACDSPVPIVILSSHPDRQSVRQAARCGVNGFISKPFNAELVRDRLQTIVPPGQRADLDVDLDLDAALQQAMNGELRLPTEIDLESLREVRENPEAVSIADLEARWRHAPALVSRLIDVSNSGAFHRPGPPNTSLREALQVLGLATALNLATAMALDMSATATHPALQERARHFARQGEQVAERAAALARHVHADGNLCYAAGLLHCLGELGVIGIAQQYHQQGLEIRETELANALDGTWPSRLAGVLKTRLRLSLALKQMIGAVYGFGLDSGSVHLPVMRAAYLLATDQSDADECQRLLKRLGLNREHIQNEA